MRHFFIYLCLILPLFANCKFIGDVNFSVANASLMNENLFVSNENNFGIFNINTKEFQSLNFKNITSLIANENELFAGFKDGELAKINLNTKSKSTLLNYDNTKLFASVSNLAIMKDRVVFTLFNNIIASYDFINNIYKLSKFENSSKVLFSDISDDFYIFSTFLRNVYKYDIKSAKITQIFKASKLITAMSGDFIALVDGEILDIKTQKQVIKLNKTITALKKHKNTLLIGLENGEISVLNLGDLNLSLNLKTQNDWVKLIFSILDNEILALSWDGKIYKCEIKS